MATIKVAVRCRPFSEQGQLGVEVLQTSEATGEIGILNHRNPQRFAFSWAWWSAFGAASFCQGNEANIEQMQLVDQQKVHDSCGASIMGDFLSGMPVVLFAYGLSGSGKTFTVFGPDAAESTEAWYRFSEPHPLWGIFPRIAHEVFQRKTDGWVVSIRYFQNIVNSVRDLTSPTAQEHDYKKGLHKDADGFLEFDWVQSVPVESFDDLRRTILE